ncbi:hypothetical protein [Streptomyces boncukensis]|uniref:hypothetical protein n=1 Tax=Streptomyces boncukensis TaxID=2711219 RepID=UPI0019D010E4|nr:hypothetical protein [Streptomyces boncukensis]
MRIRRAAGAVSLVLAATVVLAGCTDEPKDKAFGGAGSLKDLKDPKLPSLKDPSLRPSAPGLESTGGLSSGGSDGSSSSGGSSSGGLTSGGSGSSSSGLSSGRSGGSDLPTARPTPRRTYSSSAYGEVDGKRCRYSRSLRRISYDVALHNRSSDQTFRYSFNVRFKVGSSPSSSIATRTIGSRYQSVTLSPGARRTVTVSVAKSANNQRMVYSCQVRTPRKFPR